MELPAKQIFVRILAVSGEPFGVEKIEFLDVRHARITHIMFRRIETTEKVVSSQ